MKLAFVGMGSIGARHLKNVCSYLRKREIPYEIDLYRSGVGKPLDSELEVLIKRCIFTTSDYEVDGEYDVVFVTNPTSLHYDTLVRFQKKAKAFFIEKPVFDTVDVNISVLKYLKQELCYVACPLRYNPVIEYVIKNIERLEVISVRAISSSYLPEWRPGVDYRNCYSAHADMGGGVDIDLIHEWDYLTHLFGDVDYGFAIREKISNLEIDSNDIAIYIAKAKQVAIELHLDYYGRKTQRILQLITRNDTINCDIVNGKIEFLNEGKEIVFNSERNAYQITEIEHFFDIVLGKIPNDSTIEHGLKVLKYAKGEF